MAKWLDLQAHGLKLTLLRTVNRHHLVISGEDPVELGKAKNAGFKAVTSRPDLMARTLDRQPIPGQSVDDHLIDLVLRAFPRSTLVTYDPERDFRDPTTVARPPVAPDDTLISGKLRIGDQGTEVTVRRVGPGYVVESGFRGMSSDDVTPHADLAVALKGFVDGMVPYLEYRRARLRSSALTQSEVTAARAKAEADLAREPEQGIASFTVQGHVLTIRGTAGGYALDATSGFGTVHMATSHDLAGILHALDPVTSSMSAPRDSDDAERDQEAFAEMRSRLAALAPTPDAPAP